MEGVWPDSRYQSCLICPKCNVRSCRRWKSSTPQNRDRFFYKCPAPETDHKYFKWEDEVKPHEFIQVPYCGGCSAGVCRVKRETTGPNAGRIMFMCRVKEGEGSCGYRVWQDELIMSEAAQAEESRQRDEGTDIVSPFLEPSDDVIFRELIASQTLDHEVISRKTTDQFKCLEEKPNTTSRTRRPHKRSRYGDIVASGFPISDRVLTVRLALKSTARHRWMADAIRQNLSTELNGWWGRLVFHPKRCLMTSALKPSTSSVSFPIESTFVVRDVLVHCSGSIPPARTKGVKSYRKLSFNLEPHHSPIDSTFMAQEKILENSNDVMTSNEPSDKPATHSIMSRSISNVLHQAAERLQNELIARLETMDVKDHEAMSEAAEATFAALDCLAFDYKDFKKRAKELIHFARQLVEIDRAMPTNASYQKLVEICSSEREELDKINCEHVAAVEAVINRVNRIKALQEEIFLIEAEVSCCEVEVRNWELQLEKICKDKEVLEEKYLIASKEVEESQKLLDQKEAEENAAKAAFRMARALLRG